MGGLFKVSEIGQEPYFSIESDIETARTIAYLECYIKEFKRPGWLSWFGFYEQKERVKKAERYLQKLKQKKLFANTNNASHCGLPDSKAKCDS